MTKLGREDVDVYAAGEWGKVVGIHDASGTASTTEYLTTLPKIARAQFQAVADRLAALGMVANTERFHRLQHEGKPQVWEIKVHDGAGHRFYCVQHGAAWLITHAGKKPKKNTLYATEVTRCHNAMKDWEAAV